MWFQELVCHGPIDHTMIVGNRHVDHGADGDGVVSHDRPLFDRAQSQDGDVGLIDYRQPEESAENAGIGDRECALGNLFRLELLRPGALGQVAFIQRAPRPRKFFSSAFLITGTINPQSSATATPILHSRCSTTLVPSAEAFTVGKARSASTAARMKNGINVSFVPVVCSNFSLVLARRDATAVRSASSTE